MADTKGKERSEEMSERATKLNHRIHILFNIKGKQDGKENID